MVNDFTNCLQLLRNEWCKCEKKKKNQLNVKQVTLRVVLKRMDLWV